MTYRIYNPAPQTFIPQRKVLKLFWVSFKRLVCTYASSDYEVLSFKTYEDAARWLSSYRDQLIREAETKAANRQLYPRVFHWP